MTLPQSANAELTAHLMGVRDDDAVKSALSLLSTGKYVNFISLLSDLVAVISIQSHSRHLGVPLTPTSARLHTVLKQSRKHPADTQSAGQLPQLHQWNKRQNLE